MNGVDSDDNLNDCLDNDKYWALINSSNWPTTMKITLTSRHQLLQHFLVHEVLYKRRSAMNCLAAGMSRFNVLPLLRKHIDAFIDYVRDVEHISIDKLLSSLSTTSQSVEEEVAFQWLKNYMESRDSMLKYCGCVINSDIVSLI